MAVPGRPEHVAELIHTSGRPPFGDAQHGRIPDLCPQQAREVAPRDLDGRFHSSSISMETGLVIPNVLCIAARASYAAIRASSRSDQVRARTTVHRVADSSEPHSNRENAVPNHLEYGAYWRSIRKQSRIRSETSRDPISADPSSSPTDPALPTRLSSGWTRHQPATSR